MASDLYHDIMKDKEHLEQSNPRLRMGSGGLTSSDFEYRNYLSSSKSRNKNNDSRSSTPSFVDSAVKAQNVINSHITKNSNVTSANMSLQNNSHSSDPEAVGTESIQSVGKLRSLFDKSPEAKRKSNINVDSILATESEAVPADSNESIAKINVNNPKYRKDSNKRSSVSEFDNFEDRIVPSGKLKIDVDSLVASSDLPSEELTPIANDLSDKKQDNNIDFRKELELERLKRTEEEVHIEKRFNIKRRSLKDKLKDILSPTSDYSYGFEEANNSKEEKPTKQKEIIDSNGKEIIKKDKNDNYKSAVERFDEFLTSEKISPSDEVTGQIELKDGDELITSSETDELLLEPNLDNSTSLMDSILHHIEDNSDDKTNESYIHLLHPSDAKSSQFSTDNIDGSLSNNSSLEEIDAESTNTEDYSEEGYTSESTTCNSDTESQQTEDDTTAVEEYEDIEEDLPVLKSCLSRTDNKEKRRIGFHNKIEDYILTYGPSEYDRANADIDPIASSAEWELEKRVDNMDVFSVDLEKDERGLGLSIIGLGVGTETGVEKLGIFVKTLTENGAAQKDGRIQVNDQILEVNGVSLVGVTQYFAAQTLKNTSGIVRFLMGREKSRRTNIAPGSALAENPEMQRHIQEMKQTLHQMEEMEDRALSAEKTLEEVKEELLAAEERAHEAEQQLKETKDQLKAVAESPFVNGQRKMKNEIKKKAGKSEKIDDLQKTLKDMSKRLSSSEENLLELSTKNEDKEKKLFEFESRIGKLEIENDNLSETNMNLNNNINMKNDEIIELTKQNEELKAKLQKLSDQLETDKIYFEEREVNLKEQYAKEKEKSIKEMEELLGNFRKQEETVLNLQSQVSSSEKMRAEIIDLKEKLQDFDNLKVQVKLQGELVLENEKVMKEQNAEIDQLQKTKEYLQILITKLDDTESETIQQLNEMIKEKENVFNNERNELLSKISELESKSENTADIKEIEVDVTTPVQHKIDTPPLPQRKSPTSSESSTAPFIARETKPSIPSVDLPLEESKASYVNDVIVASTVEDNFTAPSFSSIRDFDTESSSSSIPDSSTEDLVVEFEFDITIPKGGTLEKPDRTLSSNGQLAAPKAEFDSSYNNEELTGSVDTVISVDPSDEPYLVIDVPLQLSEIKRTSNSSSDDEDSHIKENIQIELESFNAEVNVKQDENIEDSGIQRDISPTSEIPVPSSISVELPVQKNINYTDVDVPSSYVVTSLSDNNNDEIMLPTNLESERDFEEGITSVENTSETYKIPDKFIVGSPISLSLPLQIDDGTVESETTPDMKNYEIETEVPEKHLDEVIPTKSITSDRPASFKEQFSLDEGQFEMVQEDFQEEPHTPLTLAKHNNTTLDVASSSDEDLTASASYELDESMRKDSFSNWLGQDLKRMGTLEKEARAEIIAQQVLAKSPVKRQSSSASSSSSDDGKEPGSLIDEPLDRKQSVKIDSSYFEKSNLEESFDANFGMGVSILDDEVEHPNAHEPVSVKRSSSFDSAIPETRVLDNRMLQAKRAIVKFDNRRKPTKGIHGSIAEGLDDEFQINSLSNVAAKPEFKSTPNLLSSTSTPASVSQKAVSLPRSNSFTATNKPEKKHRFPFHLPKVFKKKVGRKSSQSGPVSPTYTPNDSSFNKSVTLPTTTANVSSVSSMQSARSTPHIEDSPTLNSSEPRSSDSDLVPMHEKTSVTNDVGNSDAATDEESVVPFAAKEELMLNNNKSDGSPVMTFRINNGHQHYQQSPTSSQSSHITVSDASHESGFNERAIDVGFIEEANDMVSKVPAQQWNTTQVGLWLIENNLSNYVNPFKLHRVDGVTLLRANGSALKDIGVSNYEDRAEFKRLIRELRAKLDKNDFARLKIKDKNRYQFWRGKHKLSQ